MIQAVEYGNTVKLLRVEQTCNKQGNNLDLKVLRKGKIDYKLSFYCNKNNVKPPIWKTFRNNSSRGTEEI